MFFVFAAKLIQLVSTGFQRFLIEKFTAKLKQEDLSHQMDWQYFLMGAVLFSPLLLSQTKQYDESSYSSVGGGNCGSSCGGCGGGD